MKKFTLIFPLFLMLTSVSFGNIINVPNDYSTIQAAINASVDGDTILVEPGTYMENINYRDKNIVITSRYYISRDPSYISSTIINGSSPVSADTASCVIISGGQDSSAILQGFTLTGGGGTKWLDIHGAGTYREGGGILIELSSPTIQHNIIRDNLVTNTVGVVSTGGGGIRIGDGNLKILNNIIIGNTGKYGAGVVLNYTGVLIKNNVIANNFGSNAYGAGSGIWNTGGSLNSKVIENNTIVNNSATAGTAGIQSYTSILIMRNNIIWGNTAPGPNQISGSVSVRYCDVQGGFTGEGNINVAPTFDSTNYYLATGSAGIDEGDTSIIYNDLEDSLNPGNALFPSRGTLRNDMGAYGGSGATILGVSTVSIQNISQSIPEKFYLAQNFPNPFNPSTKIKFDIPKSAGVKLIVYDITGREVASLVDERLEAGSYQYTFNAVSLPSGTYFYTIDVDGVKETKKMVLLK